MHSLSDTSKLLLDLAHLSSSITETNFLRRLENGNLSQNQWREFAVQRYLLSSKFEGLLWTGIQTAREKEDNELFATLQSNFNDEKGIDANGQPTALGPHEVWRENFYTALGIEKQMLKNTTPSQGVQTYTSVVQQIIKNKFMLEIAGALLFLEYNIPLEFLKIKAGRDITFQDEFEIFQTDSDHVKQNKRRARMYIDHHIGHDSEQHYPELLEALKKYMANQKAVEEIKSGIQKIAQAKKTFYDLL